MRFLRAGEGRGFERNSGPWIFGDEIYKIEIFVENTDNRVNICFCVYFARRVAPRGLRPRLHFPLIE